MGRGARLHDDFVWLCSEDVFCDGVEVRHSRVALSVGAMRNQQPLTLQILLPLTRHQLPCFRHRKVLVLVQTHERLVAQKNSKACRWN